MSQREPAAPRFSGAVDSRNACSSNADVRTIDDVRAHREGIRIETELLDPRLHGTQRPTRLTTHLASPAGQSLGILDAVQGFALKRARPHL